MLRRFIASAVAAAAVGAFTLVVLLCADVVGKLYLAGHSIEPPWYDDAAAAVVFGGALAAAVIGFVRTRRRLEARSAAKAGRPGA